MWDPFLIASGKHFPMQWSWMNWPLVAVSVLIAIGSATMALYIVHMSRHMVPGSRERRIARLSSQAVLCGGIWTMHFLGMLAFEPFINGEFKFWPMALSMLPCMLTAWITVRVQGSVSPPSWVFLLGYGALAGVGLLGMHFWGTSGTDIAPHVRYAPNDMLVTFTVAALLPMLALGTILSICSSKNPSRMAKFAGGTITGAAYATVYYMGIGALQLVSPPPDLLMPVDQHVQWNVVLVLIGFSALLGVLLLVINISLRYRQMFAQIEGSEAHLRTVVDTAIDGIIMIDVHGRITSFNQAAERLLGYRAEEVIGRTMFTLIPGPTQPGYDSYLHRRLALAHASVNGLESETRVLHKNGELLDVRLAIGHTANLDPPMFVGFITDIRERKMMEASLRRSEEQYRTLINNIPGAAFRRAPGTQWKPIFLSSPVLNITGWTAQALLDGTVGMTSLIHPDDLDSYNDTVAAAMLNGDSYFHEHRLIHRDGTIHWVSENGSGVYDDSGELLWIDGVLADVTEVKTRNAEFAGIVSAINRGLSVVEYDMEGRVLNANSNFLTLFGYNNWQVLGQYISMFYPTDNEDAVATNRAVWERVQQGEFQSDEFQYAASDGRPLWVQASFNPILDAGGKPFKVVQLITDMTLRRTIEQDLLRAEAVAEARSGFLANMSHEIRTPMNAIIGFTEALLETELQPEQSRYLGIVHRSAHFMLRLLNDILDTIKLDKGAMTLESVDFCTRDLCQQVIDEQRIQAERKNLYLRLEVDEGTPEWLRGDGLRVQQILTNIIGNAIKFTHDGGVVVSARYVRHTDDNVSGQLILKVRDTGIGMTPEQIRHIFDPFTQADASTTRRYGGTGLGTTISRQLAELMKGRITVDSEFGKGSCFTVVLPLPTGQPRAGAAARKGPAFAGALAGRVSAPGPDAHTGASNSAVPPQAGKALVNLQILAADDVPQNLELLDIVMRKQGHTVTMVSDGTHAVKMRRTQEFDLILMDLQMPEMDGLAATRAIREWEKQSGSTHVPIIALSASVLAQDRDAAREAGMDGFAAKPLEMANLMAEISRVVRPRAANAQPPVVPTTAHTPEDAPIPERIEGVPEGVFEASQAISLWGTLGPLRKGWTRLVTDWGNNEAELHALLDRAAFAELAALAHRLRGAAGNLSLKRLHTLLGEVEQAARSIDPAPDVQRIRQRLGAVCEEIPHVHRLLDATAPAPVAQPDGGGVGQTPPAGVSPEVREALTKARAALADGEMPDELLGTLNRLLGTQATAALQDALDMFDFDRAITCIQKLEKQLDQ